MVSGVFVIYHLFVTLGNTPVLTGYNSYPTLSFVYLEE